MIILSPLLLGNKTLSGVNPPVAKKKISKPGEGIGKALQRSLFSFGYMRLQAYRESTQSEVLWGP
jgi:hypothetical protein